MIMFRIFGAALLLASPAHAATYLAASTSHADVTTAIGLSSAGDTVQIPSGSASWGSVLTLSKMITLEGAGAANTIITNTHGGITINVNLQAGGGRCIIRNLQIDGSQTGAGVTINDNTASDNWREFEISNVKLVDCNNQAIDVLGVVAGLIHSSEFVDCDRTFHFEGHNDQSWDEPPYIGSTKTTVIEDCTVTHSVGTWSNTVLSSGGHGMRRVMRYCTVTNNSTKKGSPFFDTHGNQASVTDNNAAGAPENGIRGSRTCETYSNTFDQAAASGGGNLRFDLRGGINLIWGNTLVGTHWSGCWYVREEDNTDPPDHLITPLATYPGYDMHWLFLWGNTVNGTPNQPTAVTFSRPVEDAVQVMENTNMFFRAPQSGDPAVGAGGAGDGPTTSATTEAIFPYAPLAYPHPWRGNSLTADIITIGP